MKPVWKDLLLAVCIAWIIPWVILVCVPEPVSSEPVPQETAPEEETLPPERMIPVLRDGNVTDMPLVEYLTGVLLGELPGSFHMEAKKAQAVVARTYALRTVALGGKHPGAVCTDSGCCQAYRDPEEFLRKGGEDAILRQARQAVTETEDLVLTYGGELIEATYFSSSGGYTEDAVAVWGADVPYLKGVSSPEDAASREKTFSGEALRALLGISPRGDPESWFGAVTYTRGGGVETMHIGGKAFKGTQLRSLLELRSTVFTVRVEGDAITFTTKGYGHRVGMSQYGAQAMAQAGNDYRQILAHYYTDTLLEPLDGVLHMGEGM